MKTSFKLGASCIAALLLTACGDGGYNMAADGVVVDSRTGEPIPHAFVIAYWTHYSTDFASRRTSCAHVEVAQANQRGEYRIPPVLLFNLLEVRRMVIVYKPEYDWFIDETRSGRGRISLPRFAGSYADWRRHSPDIRTLEGCAPWEDTDGLLGIVNALKPLYHAMDQEIDAHDLPPDSSDARRHLPDLLTWERELMKEAPTRK